jgi:hypothetical protein
VIGLSLGCEVLLPVLAETVVGLRRASRNPSLRILVGGSIFVENPGYANLVGADATAVMHAVQSFPPNACLICGPEPAERPVSRHHNVVIIDQSGEPSRA